MDNPLPPIPKESSTFPLRDSDLVIIFRLPIDTLKPTTTITSHQPPKLTLQTLLKRLLKLGLHINLRRLDNTRLAIYLRSPDTLLAKQAYRSHVVDTLHGVGTSSAFSDKSSVLASMENLTVADRLRLVYELIVSPTYKGGVGLVVNTPDQNDSVGGEYVAAVFPLHDKSFNKEWMKTWSQKTVLTHEDFEILRNHHGEQVAFYFYYTQHYFKWLSVPAVIGWWFWWFDVSYSYFYSIMIVVWSAVYLQVLKARSNDISVLWGTKNCESVETLRPDFVPEKFIMDPVTNQVTPVYSNWKRVLKIAFVRVPLEISLCFLLLALVTVIFSIEMFTSIYYQGPWKEVVVFLPTILYVLSIPTLTTLYTNVATRVNKFENHPTETSHQYAFTQKIFSFTFLISYASLFLLAFFLIPFSSRFNEFVNWFGYAKWNEYLKTATISPELLHSSVIYYMVTGQVVNALVEVVVPILLRFITRLVSRKSKPDSSIPETDRTDAQIIQQTLKELALPSVQGFYEDYAEMIVQFGYIVFFSTVWPLAPLACFINNWVELRSDSVKFCLNSRRPIPQRSENIGPWFDNLRYMSWLASLTNAALLAIYNDSLSVVGEFGVWDLVFVFGFEHLFVVVTMATAWGVNKLPSPVQMQLRKVEYEIRKRLLARDEITASPDSEVRPELLAKEFMEVVSGRISGSRSWDNLSKDAEKMFQESWKLVQDGGKLE